MRYSGSGANNATGEADICLDLNCLDCQFDYGGCSKCDVSSSYYLNGTRCIFVNDIAVGSGGDNTSGKVLPCSQDGCIECQNDCQACIKCEETAGWQLKGNKCQKKAASATLTLKRFSAGKATAEVRFSASLGQLTKLSEPFDVKFKDSLENKEYSCEQIKCKLQTLTSNGFILEFSSNVAIVKGELLINQAASTQIFFEDSSVWELLPIVVPEVSFPEKGGATAAAGVAGSVMNNARLPVSIAISFAAPAAASFLDGLFNTLFLLKMMEGPLVSIPDAILNSVNNINLIPFKMTNPIESWLAAGPQDCEPSEQLTK